MKEKVEVLNVSKWKLKKGEGYGSVMRYRMLSDTYISLGKYTSGYPIMAVFTDNENLFNDMNDSSYFGVGGEITFTQVKDQRNPLNTKMKASVLKIGTSTFNLL